jgi:hypothetical protein
MAGDILVPMRRSDQIDDFLPYLEQVAQPGMKVVFLLRSDVDGFKNLADQLLAIHTGIRPDFLPAASSKEDVTEERRFSAERQLLPVCDALKKRGVDIRVNVYAGSLRRVVREYMQEKPVRLVMMRPRVSWIARHVCRVSRIVRRFNSVTFPPVILLHSGK